MLDGDIVEVVIPMRISSKKEILLVCSGVARKVQVRFFFEKKYVDRHINNRFLRYSKCTKGQSTRHYLYIRTTVPIEHVKNIVQGPTRIFKWRQGGIPSRR